MKKYFSFLIFGITLASFVALPVGAVTKQFQYNTLSGGSLTTSLTSYYKLDDVNDYYSTNNLTNTNSVSFVAGKVGNAASFDGATNYLSLGSAISAATKNVSIGGWFYIPSASDRGILMGNGDSSGGGSGNGYHIWIGSGTGNSNGNDWGVLFGLVAWRTFNASIGTGWHHLIVTIDNGQVARGYLDGTVSASTFSDVPNAPSGNFSLGRGRDNGTSYFFDGKADEPLFYTKALSANEVTDLYNAGVGQTMCTVGTDCPASGGRRHRFGWGLSFFYLKYESFVVA